VHRISAEWGAQRIKGLSLKAVVAHVFKKAFVSRLPRRYWAEADRDLTDRAVPLSEAGTGSVVGACGRSRARSRGRDSFGIQVDHLQVEEGRVVAVEGVDAAGDRVRFAGDYVFSTMPVRDLIRAISAEVPAEVKEVSEGLMYRDFITVGLLVKKLTVHEDDGHSAQGTIGYIFRSRMCTSAAFRSSIIGVHGWVADPSKVWIVSSISATRVTRSGAER